MDCSPVGQDKHSAKLLAMWLTQLRMSRQRGMLIFAGGADWCRAVATQTLETSELARVTWVSTIEPLAAEPSSAEQPAAEVLSAKQAKGLLGQERDVIVFDAHAGFDADAFGAVSGTIVGGGLLLLLCPPLDEWPQFADPAAERIAVWPQGVGDLPGRFLQRLSRLLKASITADEQIVLLTPDSKMDVALQAVSAGSLSSPVNSLRNENDDALFRSEDQRTGVAAIEHVLHGHRHRPLVLVADRGRGKTAALGIAAARLLRDASHGVSQQAHSSPRALRIVVTAPRLTAVEPLFQQALKILPQATLHGGHLQWGGSVIQFVAPDELCAERPSADLLLLDEAAAIPVSILQPLLTHYSRIVFSTTTHGYEGTGRGFAVRFRQTLDAQTPGWSELILRQPIRWATGDPLERFVFDSLLLDAGCAEDALVSSANLDSVQVERIARGQLLNDEALLNQLFGLLVVAHYRTRPNDLRNLLDGPGLAVYVMRHEGSVVATALVATEGGFDKPLIDEITAGRRRPRGHMIPQSLMAHLGLKSAGELRCARVMRIAVHPALQRRGLGRRLLQFIKAEAKDQRADLFGASFGATASLIKFWRSENLWPVRMGFRRDHASGEHSVMMLSALSEAGESVVAEACSGFRADFPQTLSDPLRELDAGVVSLLLQQKSDSMDLAANEPSQRDVDNLRHFIEGERSYEDCLASLWRCVVWAMQHSKQPSVNREQGVLVAKVLQRHSWETLAKRFDLAGKADVKRCLQLALRQLNLQ